MTASPSAEPGPQDDPADRDDLEPAADPDTPGSPGPADRLRQLGQVPRTFVAIRIGLGIVLFLTLLVSMVLLLQTGVVGAVLDTITGYLDWLPLVG